MSTTKISQADVAATLLRPAQMYWSRRQASHQTLSPSQLSSVASFVPTVFIVDDDREMRESLELLLLAESFQVESYVSAEDFWDVFHPERQGCLILDLRMPGMGGFALLERLAQCDHELSVIVVSASADRDERLRAKELGAIDFLPKPCDTKKLLAAIRQRLTQ